MAINRKLGHSSQNWDAEPPPSIEVVAPAQPKPGDLVSPRQSSSLCPHPKHSGYMLAVPLYDRQTSEVLKKTNGRHALVLGDIQFTTGIYVGEIHLNESRKMQTGSHWTSSRAVKGLMRVFHVFMFGSQRVLLELQDVDVMQALSVDDESSDDDA